MPLSLDISAVRRPTSEVQSNHWLGVAQTLICAFYLAGEFPENRQKSMLEAGILGGLPAH